MDNTIITAGLFRSDDSCLFSDDPYIELASAIVLRAVKDYIKTLRALWKKDQPKDKKRDLLIDKIELEDFFHSDWYRLLTELDPNRLLYGCRMKAMEKEKEAIRKKNIATMKRMKVEEKARAAVGCEGALKAD